MPLCVEMNVSFLVFWHQRVHKSDYKQDVHFMWRKQVCNCSTSLLLSAVINPAERIPLLQHLFLLTAVVMRKVWSGNICRCLFLPVMSFPIWLLVHFVVFVVLIVMSFSSDWLLQFLVWNNFIAQTRCSWFHIYVKVFSVGQLYILVVWCDTYIWVKQLMTWFITSQLKYSHCGFRKLLLQVRLL